MTASIANRTEKVQNAVVNVNGHERDMMGLKTGEYGTSSLSASGDCLEVGAWKKAGNVTAAIVLRRACGLSANQCASSECIETAINGHVVRVREQSRIKSA